MFDEPLTVAVNCRVPPDVTVAVAGDTATVPEPAGLTVTVVDADLVLSAWLVACTVTLMLELQVGAVRVPEEEMEPADALQVTAWL